MRVGFSADSSATRCRKRSRSVVVDQDAEVESARSTVALLRLAAGRLSGQPVVNERLVIEVELAELVPPGVVVQADVRDDEALVV